MVIAPRFLVRLRKGKKNMKFKNSIFAGLCSAALAVSIIPVSAEGSDTAFCEAVPENVRILGRTVYNDDLLWLANSVSGVEFTVTGSQVTFNLSVSGDPTRIGVYLNGQLYQRGLISSKKGQCDCSAERWREYRQADKAFGIHAVRAWYRQYQD